MLVNLDPSLKMNPKRWRHAWLPSTRSWQGKVWLAHIEIFLHRCHLFVIWMIDNLLVSKAWSTVPRSSSGEISLGGRVRWWSWKSVNIITFDYLFGAWDWRLSDDYSDNLEGVKCANKRHPCSTQFSSTYLSSITVCELTSGQYQYQHYHCALPSLSPSSPFSVSSSSSLYTAEKSWKADVREEIFPGQGWLSVCYRYQG